MALRFSARLMVIQNACPRFSSFTLPSVIYPARSFMEARSQQTFAAG
jgi:hypothetical protein